MTSANAAEARNFARDEYFGHAERYRRAREFYPVVAGLWDSWQDDAFVRNKAGGEYYTQKKPYLLGNSEGFFRVKGPLSVARPPQGHPVTVQAGSSESGRDLTAHMAEVVFTAQSFLASAQDFYADLKGRLGQYGCSTKSLKNMSGVFVVVGNSESQTREKFESFQELVEPEVGAGLCGCWLVSEGARYGAARLEGLCADKPASA